jgi:putative restriction endonuclease
MDWSRDHLLIAMHLYCQIPFGQISHRNRMIVAVAERMGRTPSSLSMKMCNFASLDPVHRARGIKGLRNASRADRAIWEEFNSDWNEATDEAASAILSLLAGTSGATAMPRIPEIETDRLVQTVARKGQDFFRQAVLSSYRNVCCVTGLAIPELLVASHIIPWKADKRRRLDPTNGLCLSALHDKAFDCGLIAFDDECRLLVGGSMRRESRKHPETGRVFLAFEGERIRMPERFTPDPEALRYHRERIFKAA